MKVLLSGATGFVGKAVVMRLLHEGNTPIALVRNIEKAKHILGDELQFISYEQGQQILVETISQAQAVINLAGAPILPKRWTIRRKRELINSRVEITRKLVEAIGKASKKPDVIISASAVGYYGNTEFGQIEEIGKVGEGFLARLCEDWEAAARNVDRYGVRLAVVRIGVVLGLGGGVLQSMLPIFRKGLGGPLGNGKQIMSWIHIDDLVEVLLAPIADPSMRGVYNATAPNPVSNKEFSRALGDVLGKPSRFWVPEFVIKAALGEAASVLLTGQRAIPHRHVEQGFSYRYQDIGNALSQILDTNAPVAVSDLK